MNKQTHEQTVRIVIDGGRVTLAGTLVVPPQAQGVVLFAHGSGSGRFSPRNRYVAQQLNQGGLATLLMDLLTPEEERLDEHTAHLRFDISLLAARLIGATDWLLAQQAPTWKQTQTGQQIGQDGFVWQGGLGYFGASTGAAAALIAAAERPAAVQAVVSRGGRPDLANKALARVRAPTLLIVGGADEPVIPLNQVAMQQMAAATSKHLEIVPDATHLFAEPGALEQVAALALSWLQQHLRPVVL